MDGGDGGDEGARLTGDRRTRTSGCCSAARAAMFSLGAPPRQVKTLLAVCLAGLAPLLLLRHVWPAALPPQTLAVPYVRSAELPPEAPAVPNVVSAEPPPQIPAVSGSVLSGDSPGAADSHPAFSAAERQTMSALGRVLLLGEPRPAPRPRNFSVAVWRHGPRLERRLLRSFGGAPARPPLRDCAVQNCRVFYTDNSEQAATADAVFFHLQLTKEDAMPTRRRPDQRWIFLTDESPRHVFLSRNNISHYNGVFNWSMAYRYDTDVPVPYGRSVLGRSEAPRPPKTKLAAILGSNCDKSGRWEYIRALQKLVPVDMYGSCGTMKCPGHYDKDCAVLSDYKFYLAFENSHCDGYITEKVFWHALGKGAVPIVWGAKKRDYEKVLPPGSFIFMEDFSSVGDLARHLKFLNDTPAEYEKYHAWRDTHHVLNEHGYFGAPIHYYCRICEALNFNSEKKKVISRLDQFWGVKEHCITPDIKMFMKT